MRMSFRNVALVSVMALASSFPRVTFAQAGQSTPPGMPSGLKYDKMIYLAGDSIKTVPVGYVWQVQAILSTDESLKERGAEAFMSGFTQETEGSRIARWQFRLTTLWLSGQVFYVSGLPFYLSEGARISAGTKQPKLIIIAQYKIE